MSEHDDLLTDRSITFHIVVREPDLVQWVRLHRTKTQLPRHDPVEVSPEHTGWEVGTLASIHRQAYAIRDVADRIELLHDPWIREHAQRPTSARPQCPSAAGGRDTATIRLNEKTLADLRVPDNCIQVYYWDTELSGLGVVVGRTTKTFVARSWVNGKNRRVKIGVAGQPRPDGHLWSIALARAEARKLLGKMSAGVDLKAEL